MAVQISEISDHKYIANALDDLILPDEQKSLLGTICDSRRVGQCLPTSRKMLDQDRITTKKGSLVILLHGAPGSGKTFTAGVLETLHEIKGLALTLDRMHCKLQSVSSNNTCPR